MTETRQTPVVTIALEARSGTPSEHATQALFLALLGRTSEAPEETPAPGVRRRSGVVTIGDKARDTARIVLDEVSPAAAREGAARLIRTTPLLVAALGSPEGAPAAEVLATDEWDSPMNFLSLEDAALLERIPVKGGHEAPARTECPWAGKDFFPTPPGAAAFIRVSGGGEELPARAARILLRAAGILLRRLDISRARAAEGPALEARLLGS